MNYVEIIVFEDILGNDCFNFDIDSIFDEIVSNDLGGNLEIIFDNVVDGDGLGSFGDIDFSIDEDDYDLFKFEVFDLVL